MRIENVFEEKEKEKQDCNLFFFLFTFRLCERDEEDTLTFVSAYFKIYPRKRFLCPCVFVYSFSVQCMHTTTDPNLSQSIQQQAKHLSSAQC